MPHTDCSTSARQQVVGRDEDSESGGRSWTSGIAASQSAGNDPCFGRIDSCGLAFTRGVEEADASNVPSCRPVVNCASGEKKFIRFSNEWRVTL